MSTSESTVHRKRSRAAVIDQDGKVLASRYVNNGVKLEAGGAGTYTQRAIPDPRPAWTFVLSVGCDPPPDQSHRAALSARESVPSGLAQSRVLRARC